jgi:hypothetical protein
MLARHYKVLQRSRAGPGYSRDTPGDKRAVNALQYNDQLRNSHCGFRTLLRNVRQVSFYMRQRYSAGAIAQYRYMSVLRATLYRP